jgi:hypothetical protein
VTARSELIVPRPSPPGMATAVDPLPAAHTVRPVDPHIVARVRGEFLEMPGFSPTLAQASRLFAIPSDSCRVVLGALVREGFLRCCPDGQYRVISER